MSRRLRWDALPQVETLRLNVRKTMSAEERSLVADYLRSANLRVSDLDESDNLLVHITRFPELTFALAQIPRMTVEWPRDTLSLERTAIIICPRGQLAITPSTSALHRNPGMYLIPPGTSRIEIQAHEAFNEVLYISAPSSMVQHLDLSTPPLAPRPPVPAAALAPLYAFANALSFGSLEESIVAGQLYPVAFEVARALARLIAEDQAEVSVFTRAMRLILDHHSEPRLSVPKIAQLSGVSTRTLQSAFAAEGTTVANEIRTTRLKAAREMQRDNQGLPTKQIAAAVGFGSVSTLYRALDGE
jgi:AraC-like DNA-binding protein